MKSKRTGQTVTFDTPVCVFSTGSIVGDMENLGPLNGRFDVVLEDDTWGEKSWEKAEQKMFETSVRMAAQKGLLNVKDIDCLLSGDLLNQITTSNFTARNLGIPYIGLYGACSTMTESLLLGAMLIDGGFADCAACGASSHFSTAERQFRTPLELGNQTTPTSQRTVTGSACTILTGGGFNHGRRTFENVHITGGTIGRVIDLGVTDVNNMGAAMAPSAVDSLKCHLNDTGRDIDYYDLVVTGDLGSFGSRMMYELCKEEGIDISGRHSDCGCVIFSDEQNVDCGGSGCGCSAVVLSAYYLDRLEIGKLKRILFMSTGALMSPDSGMQGESIPGIAHAVVLEGRS